MLICFCRYHLKYLGLDHISIYDNDGSVGEYLEEFSGHPKVSYFAKWGPTEALAREAGASMYCTETYAENQCIWNARGVSEWALLMHNIDNWFASSQSITSFRNELDWTPPDVRLFPALITITDAFVLLPLHSPPTNADLSATY